MMQPMMMMMMMMTVHCDGPPPTPHSHPRHQRSLWLAFHPHFCFCKTISIACLFPHSSIFGC